MHLRGEVRLHLLPGIRGEGRLDCLEVMFQGLEFRRFAPGGQNHRRKGLSFIVACRPNRLCPLTFPAIGIDEFGLDRLAVAAHEDELIALRKTPLHDGRGERRDDILVDRPLERTRAHFRREALFEKELQRRRLPLHRPFAILEAAPLKHAPEFLLENAAHEIAAERLKHDHLVEPVLELGPEGLARPRA